MRPSFSFSVIGQGLESLGIRRPYGALTTGKSLVVPSSYVQVIQKPASNCHHFFSNTNSYMWVSLLCVRLIPYSCSCETVPNAADFGT